MISTANITMQFGAKPLFENVSVKFGGGNRYGLIGANGCGKSTFMKILGDDLEPSGGQVMLEPNVRLGKLRQDQFAYEEFTVIDTVIMGHEELWKVKAERDRIYSLAEMSEEDGMKVGELEGEFAEMDGYTAESRAGELLLGLGIPLEQHFGPMSEVAPGWKLRVLLAQALFSDPEVLLLDEPTNHLDINTIRWLENILVQRNSTMIIISHDRHFLNSVCTHMADLDYGKITLYPGNYDDFMEASTQARERQSNANAKAKERIAEHLAKILENANTLALDASTSCGLPDFRNSLLQQINAARATARTCGATSMPAVSALTWNDRLFSAAARHSQDMATNNYFSHTSLDGRSFSRRMTDETLQAMFGLAQGEGWVWPTPLSSSDLITCALRLCRLRHG